MKKLFITIAIVLPLSFTALYAEDTHDHEAHEHKTETHKDHKHSHHHESLNKNAVGIEKIKQEATEKVRSLVSEKKIHKSWAFVEISKIGKTHYGDTDDWVVGFTNSKIKNKKRQTLYIFVSVEGKIRGANYTGN